MKRIDCNKGFTLIELLVATAIFGLVVGAMYTVFSSMQKSTVNQADLVDVQQNLRVCVDMISRDIKLAGALLPAGTPAVAAGSDATTLRLETATSLRRFARVAADVEIPAGGGNTIVFAITVPAAVDAFSVGDPVRIIRPQSGEQPYDAPLGAELVVAGVDRGNAPSTTPPTITIDNFNNVEAAQYKAGDVIAGVAGGAPDPSRIVWDLNGAQLRRNSDNGGFEVMADAVAALAFDYLLGDGTETNAPTASERDDIRAVRVSVTANATRQLDGRTRPRSLSVISSLRNRQDRQ